MLGKKRTKVSRMRGSSSHGWGHKKKHRGAGHRGGVGMSGSGARADQKKPMILKKFGQAYFMKRGFHSIHKKDNRVLSIRYIEYNFDKMIDMGIINKQGNEYVFDSTMFNYDKILGNVEFTKKIKLICNEISNTAKKRIEDVGGSVECKNIATEE